MYAVVHYDIVPELPVTNDEIAAALEHPDFKYVACETGGYYVGAKGDHVYPAVGDGFETTGKKAIIRFILEHIRKRKRS